MKMFFSAGCGAANAKESQENGSITLLVPTLSHAVPTAKPRLVAHPTAKINNYFYYSTKLLTLVSWTKLCIVMKATFPSLLAALSSLSYASAQATCNPQFWSAGHDFKNGQYSHVNGTSPADWYVYEARERRDLYLQRVWLCLRCSPPRALRLSHTTHPPST